MVSRSDLQIFWHLSPRLIFVDDPSEEITIQDLHDTLRDREQEQANLIYPSLISSAGKEDLGGGVTVGVTSTLQNARVGFQARKVYVDTGTITDPDPTGELLIDTAASFLNDGVEPGAWVINTTDGSICTVLTVDTETQISTDFLGGGSDNQFDTGDAFRIINITQMEVAGGNLVAVDGYGVNIDPIFPTAGTQVVRTSASSATRVSQSQREHSVFNGVVTIDTINGTSGTTYPTGTQQQPANNVSDARIIALARGFIKFSIIGDATFDTGDDISGFVVEGQTPTKTTLTILTGADTQNVDFREATVTGVFDTEAAFSNCHLVDIEFVEANIFSCVLQGEITLAGTGATSIYNSSDGLVSGAPPPSVNFNGSGRSLAIRNYDGDIELNNKSGPEGVEINMSTGGKITLASSITNGTIRLTGIMEVENNTSGSAVIDTSQVIFPDLTQLAAFEGQVFLDVTDGYAGTNFPLGTRQSPINNLTDAKTVLTTRNLNSIFVVGNATIDGYAPDVSGITFVGQSELQSTITVATDAVALGCTYEDCTITGTLQGTSQLTGCRLTTLAGLQGILKFCGLATGIKTLSNGAPTIILNCWSGPPGADPIIDMGGSGQALDMRNYTGDVVITNKSGSEPATIHINTGHVELTSSVTNGNIDLHGTIDLTDNSIGADVDVSQVIYPEYIQLSSFEGAVHINTITGEAGTQFPCGTPQAPVDNLSDAITISVARNLGTFELHGTLVVGGTDVIDGYEFIGANPLTAVMVLITGCTTERSVFRNMILTGTINGAILCENSGLQALVDIGSETFPSIFDRCIFRAGTQTFKAGLATPDNVHFLDCVSGIPGDGYATLDFNGTTSPVGFRRYVGGLGIVNYTGGQNCTFGFAEGQFILDASCTVGEIEVDGNVLLVDNSSGLTVARRSLINAPYIAETNWNEPVDSHTDVTTLGGWLGSKVLTVSKFLGLK
jgi:hypothetical protein